MSSYITTEEKIDAIYMMLRAQESRIRRAFWYRMLKWTIIVCFAYFLLSHPDYVIGKMTEYIQPIIMEQMKDTMTTQKDAFMKQFQEMMPR